MNVRPLTTNGRISNSQLQLSTRTEQDTKSTISPRDIILKCKNCTKQKLESARNRKVPLSNKVRIYFRRNDGTSAGPPEAYVGVTKSNQSRNVPSPRLHGRTTVRTVGHCVRSSLDGFRFVQPELLVQPVCRVSERQPRPRSEGYPEAERRAPVPERRGRIRRDELSMAAA